MCINYAHRGASGYYPENTMISFEKAIDMGCTGIETDVQMTSDGVLVLMHDEMVTRTTDGTGLLKDYTFDGIQKLDAGSWMSKEFAGQKVPTAEQLILLAKEKDVIINFEIKNGLIEYKDIEEKLIELIHRHDMQEKVILSSFNHYSMVVCKQIDQSIKTGLLYSEMLYHPEKYVEYTGADAIHPNFYTLNSQIIKSVKQNGILINTWTVNDRNTMKYLSQMDIDGIITNFPDKLNAILQKVKSN